MVLVCVAFEWPEWPVGVLLVEAKRPTVVRCGLMLPPNMIFGCFLESFFYFVCGCWVFVYVLL